jgi:periplasmic protein TonB
VSLQPETPKRSGLSFLESHSSHGEPNSRIVLGAAALVALLIGCGVFYLVRKEPGPMPKPPEQPHIVAIHLPPPPPPPPPPPQKNEPEKTEMMKQEKVKINEPKPKDNSPPKPKDPLPPSVSSITGPPGSMQVGSRVGGAGLGGFGGGNCEGKNCGGGEGGSRFGWYAAIVQSQIQAALSANRKTRFAEIKGVTLNLWIDGAGRVTRVQLASSTGNAEVDSALRNEALVGVTLREAPPKDMPMPVVARVTERRPG